MKLYEFMNTAISLFKKDANPIWGLYEPLSKDLFEKFCNWVHKGEYIPYCMANLKFHAESATTSFERFLEEAKDSVAVFYNLECFNLAVLQRDCIEVFYYANGEFLEEKNFIEI